MENFKILRTENIQINKIIRNDNSKFLLYMEPEIETSTPIIDKYI